MAQTKESEAKLLQNIPKDGKLQVKDGRIVCPVCKQKTNQVVLPETKADYLQVWCPNCKAKHIVNINFGQCFVFSRCP